jgi:hypothetical protein
VFNPANVLSSWYGKDRFYKFTKMEDKMSLKTGLKNIVNDAIIKDIAQAVGSLEYGTVTLKVHDRKIIQVEVAERKRFEDIWKIEEGGGI